MNQIFIPITNGMSWKYGYVFYKRVQRILTIYIYFSLSIRRIENVNFGKSSVVYEMVQKKQTNQKKKKALLLATVVILLRAPKAIIRFNVSYCIYTKIIENK